MIIYSYKGNYKDQKEVLFEKAWYEYSLGKALPEIIRDDKGKPFFEGSSCKFSISHSNQCWVCVFSPYQVGIDIQYQKVSANELSIARRFFSKEDATLVEKNGKESFYRLWTRREAFGKYLGSGFFLPKEISYYPVIKEFTIEGGYQGAIAIEKEEKIWMKTIN